MTETLNAKGWMQSLDDGIHVIREWYDASTDENCVRVDLRIPSAVVRKAVAGDVAAFLGAVHKKITNAKERARLKMSYDARPRLTLGKRRGKP